MRRFIAALTAAAASIAIPWAMALVCAGPEADTGGPPDKAPLRAAFFIAILTPVFLSLLTAWFLVSTWLLGRFGRLTFINVILLSFIASIGVGAVFGVQGFGFGGLRDAAQSFLVFGAVSAASLGCGSCVWWFLRPAA